MMKSLGKRYSAIKSNKKKGFTLMELVVVIGIMAILALVMVPNLTAYIQKADDAKSKANIKSVHIASELAVQSDTTIYAKDIKGLEATEKTKLIKEIAGYANIDVADILIPDGGVAGVVADKYYIIADTDHKLTVTFSTDRMTYVFNGRGFTESKIN